MSIRVPENLPAAATLCGEGYEVVGALHCPSGRAKTLRIGLLNLMPNKADTEVQIARLLGATTIPVDLTLVKISNHTSKNTSADHLQNFYQDWQEIKDSHFDGFVITGAPVEIMPFEQVTYWNEIREIFDWSQSNVSSCLNICWAAQAAMHFFYGTPKHQLLEKAFGVFKHRVLQPDSPYARGLSDELNIPVSRWTEIREADLPKDSGVSIIISSDETGLCALHDQAHRSIHMFNHIEYDASTLAHEYFRDLKAGKHVRLPKNYFPYDRDDQQPKNSWKSHSYLFFSNWLGEIYRHALNKNSDYDLEPFPDQAAQSVYSAQLLR